MNRNYRNVLAIAMLWGVCGTGYAQPGGGTGDARATVMAAVNTAGTANTDTKARAARWERARREAAAMAHMAQLHSIIIGGAGSLLPSRSFPLGTESYAGLGISADGDTHSRSAQASAGARATARDGTSTVLR